MGSELLESAPDVFDRYLDHADRASGLAIRRLCLEGPIEELTATEVAQPALFATSLAIAHVACERGLDPAFVAGHSLGEYTAAVASGSLPLDDGMRLVALRGRLMAEIQSERPGAMAAIMGLSADQVDDLCAQVSAVGLVAPANLNTESQIVCSGEVDAVLALIDAAERAGADRAVRLQVGAAFHSELMRPVQHQMSQALAEADWKDPRTLLVANADGEVKQTAEAICDALVAQIARPVLWIDCVRTLRKQGCDTFLELGSGRTLSALIRQIDREAPSDSPAQTFAADAPAKLDRFAERGGG